MAIFNSILIGKGKNKIGDIVLTTLKGQSIAKQINRSPANPRTVGQVSSRARMSNVVLAWQFLSLFLSYARYERKKLESTYNWFVRVVKSTMANTVFATAYEAAASLLALSGFGNAKLVDITGGTAGNPSVVVTFDTAGLPFIPDAKVVVANFDSTNKHVVIATQLLLEADWNAGTVTVPALVTATASAFAYIYSDTHKKQSNVAVITSVA